jgi:FKBP-type peptidyl-prolyl cis-trans isomerase
MYLRLSLVATVILTLVLGACSRTPKTDKDKISYTIGAQFGKSLKAQHLDLDNKALARGIVDGYSGERLQMNEGEQQAAMTILSEARQKTIQEEAAKNKVGADEFLEKNKTAEGVKVTVSGLQYKIIQEGTGPSPKMTDAVSVNYRGTLIDGREFDSSYRRNMPAEFPIKGVIPGWTEGLQLMKKGGKAMFWVPPSLGYGERPRQQIPGNAVLIFDVELLDVKPAPKAKSR